MAEFHANYDTGSDTTGDGSLGAPYKTVQKCLTEAGTTAETNVVYLLADEPLASTLSFPASSRSWIITGTKAATAYPELSSSSVALFASPAYLLCEGITLDVSAANLSLGIANSLINCVIALTSRQVTGSTNSYIGGCYFLGTGSIFAYSATQGGVDKCVFDVSGVGSSVISAPSVRDSLVIVSDATRRGVAGNGVEVSGCTIVAPDGSTDAGVFVGDVRGGSVRQCIISGFGTGVSGNNACVVCDNSFYDCSSNTSSVGLEHNNETLGASPFTDLANSNYTPLNAGSLSAGGFPAWYNLASANGTYRGASQPVAGSGSSGFTGPRGISRRVGT
jgi:hypothetical protein